MAALSIRQRNVFNTVVFEYALEIASADVVYILAYEIVAYAIVTVSSVLRILEDRDGSDAMCHRIHTGKSIIPSRSRGISYLPQYAPGRGHDT